MASQYCSVLYLGAAPRAPCPSGDQRPVPAGPRPERGAKHVCVSPIGRCSPCVSPCPLRPPPTASPPCPGLSRPRRGPAATARLACKSEGPLSRLPLPRPFPGGTLASGRGGMPAGRTPFPIDGALGGAPAEVLRGPAARVARPRPGRSRLQSGGGAAACGGSSNNPSGAGIKGPSEGAFCQET